MPKFEYHVYQDDNAMSTMVIQEEFDKMASLGWEFVGTVGFNANHMIFKRPLPAKATPKGK